MATVTAKLNNLRLAPRKVRAVTGLIKGKSLNAALDQLEYLVRRPSKPLKKLLESALANAENNFQMVRDNLIIRSLFVNEGVKLRRYMPRAQGRATEIQKKTSRVTVVLEEKVPGLKRSSRAKDRKKEPEPNQKPIASVSEDKPEIQTDTATNVRPEVKREIGTKGLGAKVKKIFQRKAV